MVSKLRARRDRVFFYFHFGDCLELCLREETMKKKFQVIHCSNTILEMAGLVNLLSAASGCLTNPDAVLLVNIAISCVRSYSSKLNSPIVEFIESSLCCSFSMIPTLNGLRLTNHLQLGSPIPVKLHEDIVKNLVTTLKWQLSLNYSSNIPLEISPDLGSAIDKLAASQFKSCDFCSGH